MPVPYINRSLKEGYFFAEIMEKIKKALSLIVVIIFISCEAYAINLPKKTLLRPYLANSAKEEFRERFRNAYGFDRYKCPTPLLDGLREGSSQRRVAYSKAVVPWLSDPEVQDALISWLRGSDRDLKIAAMDILQFGLKEENLRKRLLSLLDNSNALLRYGAVRILSAGILDDTEIASRIAAKIFDTDLSTQFSAIEACSFLLTGFSVSGKLKADYLQLIDKSDGDTRVAIINALTPLVPTDAVVYERLLTYLKEGNEDKCIVAVIAAIAPSIDKYDEIEKKIETILGSAPVRLRLQILLKLQDVHSNKIRLNNLQKPEYAQEKDQMLLGFPNGPFSAPSLLAYAETIARNIVGDLLQKNQGGQINPLKELNLNRVGL